MTKPTSKVRTSEAGRSSASLPTPEQFQKMVGRTKRDDPYHSFEKSVKRGRKKGNGKRRSK